MRLIDADLLLSQIGNRYDEKKDIVPDNLAEGFVQMEKLIKEQPTAYDVDKVVEKLEEEREMSYADFDRYVKNYLLRNSQQHTMWTRLWRSWKRSGKCHMPILIDMLRITAYG